LTYIKNGTEYLHSQERDIYEAIIVLAGRGRTVNNSQIAGETGISRTVVARRTERLAARSFIENTGKGSACHWRATHKPAPREPQPVPPRFERDAQREREAWLAQFRTEPRAAEPAGQCCGECDEARAPRRVTEDENEDVPVIYAVQGSQPLQVMVGVTKDGRVLLGAPTLDISHPVHWQSQLDAGALAELQQALGWAAMEQTQRQGNDPGSSLGRA
jgi:hypothetical protein